MARQVSWMWGGKRHYGTFIRETKTHIFARTKNGKIKKLKNDKPKKDYAGNPNWAGDD